MTCLRAVLLGLLALMLIGWTSCGDTFRPVAIPLTPTPPNPASFHYVLSLSQNGANDPGASTRIDVSGDSNVGVAQLGIGPVHAALQPTGSRIYIANSRDDSVSSYALTDATTITTTSLPTGSTPIFVAITDNATVYVANAGNGTVGAISTLNNALASSIPVGFNPVALAETPDASKVYAVGGSNSVASISTSDKSVTAVSDPAISSPVWAISRKDGRFVYVLNSGNGTVSAINTFDNSVASPVNVSPGAGANFMTYDKTFQRLYVTNPNSTQIGVVDVSNDQPAALPPLDLTAVPAGMSTICATGCTPVSVAVLPDGTRAYVVSYNVSGTNVTSQVTVFNTQSGTVRTVLPAVTVPVDTTNPTGCGTTAIIPTAGIPSVRFRFFIAGELGGSRVYVSNCDAGYTEIIQTSDDTMAPVTISAPVSSFPVVGAGGQPPRQNPVFLLAEPY